MMTINKINNIETSDRLEDTQVDMFGSIFNYYEHYKQTFPTLSDHARKLNYFMKDKTYEAEKIGKILYVRLMNDHADITVDGVKVMGRGTEAEIEDKAGFSKIMQNICGMPIGSQTTIYFSFTYNTKEYYISRISEEEWTVIDTNDVYKNARKEGGGTSPDPREDSLDYGARGGNSAAPTQFH